MAHQGLIRVVSLSDTIWGVATNRVIIVHTSRVLDLSCNNLGGGTDMLQSLSACRNLEKLGLSNCTLLDTCIYRIGTMLKANKSQFEL